MPTPTSSGQRDMLTKFELHLLACVAADLRRLRADVSFREMSDRHERGKAAQQHMQANRDRLVPLDLRSWCGGTPSEADRKRYQRAAKKLEEQDLLYRINENGWSKFTTHIHLTEAGEELANQKENQNG